MSSVGDNVVTFSEWNHRVSSTCQADTDNPDMSAACRVSLSCRHFQPTRHSRHLQLRCYISSSSTVKSCNTQFSILNHKFSVVVQSSKQRCSFLFPWPLLFWLFLSRIADRGSRIADWRGPLLLAIKHHLVLTMITSSLLTPHSIS